MSSTFSSTTKTTNISAKKESPQSTNENEKQRYIVVTTTYPSTYGCNTGREFSHADIICNSTVTKSKKEYDTYEEAVKVARKWRNRSNYFSDKDDYEEEYPPFDSAEEQNYDNDEEEMIDVMTLEEFDEKKKSDHLIVNTEAATKHLDELLEKELVGIRIKDGDYRVFYSNRFRKYNIPAEFEYDESKEKGTNGVEDNDFTIPSNANSTPTVYYKVKDEIGSDNIISNYNEEKHGENNLMKLLVACTSLEELYLRSSGMYTSIGKEFLLALVKKAPHLRTSLKVLSLNLLYVEPSALEIIGKCFPNLIRLDLSDTLVRYDNIVVDPNDDSDCEYDLPFDEVIMTCIHDLKHLRRLDLGCAGGDEYYLHKYFLSERVLWEIQEHLEDNLEPAGKVTMEKDNFPEPFSCPERELSAKVEALESIMNNAKYKEKYPIMVSLAAKKYHDLRVN